MAFLQFSDTRTSLDDIETGKEIILGSSFDSDILCSEDGVAGHHLILQRTDSNFVIRPCTKKNKFKINGEEKSDETILNHRDEIRIGNEKIEFFTKEPDQGAPEERKDNIKIKIHRLLLERINLKKLRGGDESLKKKAEEVIKTLVDEFEPEIKGLCPKEVLFKEVLNEALGLGCIEEFLADPGNHG